MIGQQVVVGALWLDQGQPHLHAAFQAWHLDGGRKTCTGRRRPECWQHEILALEGVGRNATQLHQNTAAPCLISDIIGIPLGHRGGKYFGHAKAAAGANPITWRRSLPNMLSQKLIPAAALVPVAEPAVHAERAMRAPRLIRIFNEMSARQSGL